MGARRRPLLVDILARLGGILAASFQLLGGLFKPVAPAGPAGPAGPVSPPPPPPAAPRPSDPPVPPPPP